jgi:hypothetical protein
MHIDGYRFGSITIDGVRYAKDLMIIGGEVISPWWRERGGHLFAPEDLEPLIAASPEVVVLGTGSFGRVRVPEATVSAFVDVGTEVVIERTGRAVDALNRLLGEGRDVAAGLHLTC